ncbi:MAG: hypothetical protein ACOCYP_01455 [Planctomycetota bacterium]
MRRFHAVVLFTFCALYLAGCGCNKEAGALREDVDRFVERKEWAFDQILADIRYFAKVQKLKGFNLELAHDRFIEWRKREWWRFEEEFAWFITHHWDEIEKLTLDVGRHYGYHIQNFPRTVDGILRFFHQADAEWRMLVMDIMIFQEYRHRELAPLKAELKRFYDHVDWEIANLSVDVQSFLSWRWEMYTALIQDGRDFWNFQKAQGRRLAEDLERFKTMRPREHLLEADFKAFVSKVEWEVPRLIDDVFYFTQWRDRELQAIRDDVAECARYQAWAMDRLQDEITRFKQQNTKHLPTLIAEIDRFFEWREREGKPLTEDVKRFWKHNISQGKLLVADMRRYYASLAENAAELKLDTQRFVSYARVEVDGLKAALKRFGTCERDVPYGGDDHIPRDGKLPSPVFEDPPARQARTGNTGR